jgi:hypothetical protein
MHLNTPALPSGDGVLDPRIDGLLLRLRASRIWWHAPNMTRNASVALTAPPMLTVIARSSTAIAGGRAARADRSLRGRWMVIGALLIETGTCSSRR